jgi:DnaJ-class molecular chaperone
VVLVRSPYIRCAHCEGTGAVKTLTCTVCMGTGFVPLPSGPIEVCPECLGSGDDASAPAMACLTCRGRGFVTKTKSKPELAGELSESTPRALT